MKFLFLDVRDNRMVGVFEDGHGSIVVMSRTELYEASAHYKINNDWEAVLEIQEAIDLMKDEYPPPKKWWEFWK
jgi:predicted lipid carrier protein YhbT